MEAEEQPEISEDYEVAAVPFFVFLKVCFDDQYLGTIDFRPFFLSFFLALSCCTLSPHAPNLLCSMSCAGEIKMTGMQAFFYGSPFSG